MDRLVALQVTLDFSFLSTSPGCQFIDKNIFSLTFHTLSHSTYLLELTAVRQEVQFNLDSSVVVHKLELSINLALYGLM